MIGVVPIAVLVLPLLKERGFCLKIVVVQHWVLDYSASGFIGWLGFCCLFSSLRVGFCLVGFLVFWVFFVPFFLGGRGGWWCVGFCCLRSLCCTDTSRIGVRNIFMVSAC